MNVKKSLRSRIRGWFPQEPKLLGKYVQNSPKTGKKLSLFVSIAVLFTLVIVLVAFQVPRYLEWTHPQVDIRPDDSNLLIKGVINSVEENHKAEGMGVYHIFPYYIRVNISEVVWVENDLSKWISTSGIELLNVGKIVEIGYDCQDNPQLAIGQMIESKGFYQKVTDNPQSLIITIAPNISGSYFKQQTP